MAIKIKNTPSYSDVSKLVLLFIFTPMTSFGYLFFNLQPSWFVGCFLCALCLTFTQRSKADV